MRPRSRLFASAAVAATLLLGSCSNGQFSNPAYLSVSITPRPASIPAGGSVTLAATVSNNLSLPVWSIVDAADTPNAGTLTAVAGSNTSITFTAPSAPPIYTGAAVGFTQGVVTVEATVAPPPLSTLTTAHDSVSIFITAPTISVGISPAAVTVPLGTQQYFAAYAVGSVDNALTYEVNGVPGGSTATGTITSAGVYTAPSAVPMTGNTVTITIVSQADPTKTASATVTLA